MARSTKLLIAILSKAAVFLGITLLCIITAWFFNVKYFSIDNIQLYDDYDGGYTVGTQLKTGDVLEQPFEFNGTLHGVELKMWTPEKENKGILQVSVEDKQGNIAKGTQQLAEIKTIVPFQVLFDRSLVLEKNEQYTLKLEILELAENSNITFMGSMAAEDEIFLLRFNGSETMDRSYLGFYGLHADAPKAQHIFFVFMIVLWVISMIITAILMFGNWQAQHYFLVIAVLFCALYQMVLPPLSAPDEDAHATMAYYYSNYLWGETETKQINDDSTFNWRFPVRKTEHDLQTYAMEPAQKDYLDLIDSMDEPGSDGVELRGKSRGRVLSASVVAYLPQTIGVTLARLLHLNSFWTIYFGRICSSIAYIALAYWGIRKMPVYKTMLAMVALLPMSLHLAASYSYDVLVLGGAFLFTGQIMQLSYGNKKLSISNIIVLIFSLLILSSGKGIYIFMAILFLLVPYTAFGSRLKKYITLGVFLALGVVFFLINMLPSLGYKSPAEIVSSQSNNFVWILMNTLVEYASWYLKTMFGGSLGWLEIDIPWIITVAAIGVVSLSILSKENQTVSLRVVDRIVYGGLFFLIGGGCMVAAMGWNPETSSLINGVQGRYLLPVLPCFLLACSGARSLRVTGNIDKVLFSGMTVVQILTLITTFNTIMAR